MLPSDIFSPPPPLFFSFSSFFLSTLTGWNLGGLGRKEGRKEKMCLQSCRFKGGCNRYSNQGMAKKARGRTQHLLDGWQQKSFTSRLEMFALHILENIICSYVILFVDRHRTHLPYQRSELCSEMCITLISLYLNATRLFQSPDAATIRPLKLDWKPADLKWHKQNPDKILNKEWFAPVLDGALKKRCLECSAIRSFRACGL